MLWWTLRQLKSADEWKRIKAIEKLGTSKDTRAVEYLISSLKDTSYEVRAKAAEYLGEIGDERAVEPLLKLFDAEVVRRAQALRPSNRLVKDKAAEAKRRDKLAKDSDYVRQKVIIALDKLYAVEHLISSLEDTSYGVREKAAGYLGKIGDKRAIAPLLKLLEDESARDKRERGDEPDSPIPGYVRQTVIEALDKLGDEQVKKSFVTLLKDNDRNIRLAAADALEQVELMEVKQALSEYRNSHEGKKDERLAEEARSDREMARWIRSG